MQRSPVNDPGLQVALARLMPMYLQLDRGGVIRAIGPTLAKLQDRHDLLQQDFFQCFQVHRPQGLTTMEALRCHRSGKLALQLRAQPDLRLKASSAPLAGGALLNLSFGIAVQEAVRRFSLTAADFAPTDLSVEMLYLIEAKSAAMASSQRLNSRLQGAKIAAEEQAFTDTLTGLKNRRAMEHVLARLRDSDAGYSLMHLDLDYFKAVNDTLGHAAGDHVLQQVARILISETRKGDTIIRYGGDEFVLLLPGEEDRATLRNIADRLIARLEQPILFEGQTCEISASIGITRSSDYDDANPWQMLADADSALYQSKRNGRAQHQFHFL